MGSSDEFGPDTASIRAWLDKRATYARDARVVGAPAGATGPRPSSDVPRGPEGPDGPDGTDLGRTVVEALRADRPASGTLRPGSVATPDPEPTPDSEPTPQPAPTLPPAPGPLRPPPPPRVRKAPEVRHGGWTEPEDNLTLLDASTDAEFPPRRGVRRALSWVLLAVLAAAGAASYAAVREPTEASVGLAGILGLLLLVVWAVRAGTTTTQLAIRRGQLSIRRNGRTEVVDVASPYTPIAMVGEPGERRWTVLIERQGLPLVVIDRSMVDPHWFTTTLYRLRPGLRQSVGTEENVF
ncbi:hypothetical protein ACJ5H2_02820 [Nocardioides sp. R1-1]|uniref:hypothetical protein n=1 Tax=Nocardioides sp. R1-1 TaxID=3383502 RepID=UPI0038D209DA